MYIKYKRLLNGHTQIKIVVRQYWHHIPLLLNQLTFKESNV